MVVAIEVLKYHDHLTMGALACCTMLSVRSSSLFCVPSLSGQRRKASIIAVRMSLLLDCLQSRPIPLPADPPSILGDIQSEKVAFKYERCCDLGLGVSICDQAGTITGVKGNDGPVEPHC